MSEAVLERRRRSPRPPVDVAVFAEQVDAALEAFGEDVSYAVAMARQAVIISRKRAVWQARKESREAARAA